MKRTTCRSCGSGSLEHVLDLGEQSPSNALLTRFDETEKKYPLQLVLCTNCWLMQTGFDVPHEELFNASYPYYSGSSQQWREHCKSYEAMITRRLGLHAGSYVIEVGGNDGTLLQHFHCDTLNVEPSVGPASVAMRKNIPTVVDRFQHITGNPRGADLIIANNVMAHDPDLNGFAAAIRRNLAARGTCTIEFPWAVELLDHCEFDTIYHEHYSYLSLTALEHLFARHGLATYDAEYLPVHGGSIRVYVTHADKFTGASAYFYNLLDQEVLLRQMRSYEVFRERAFNCAGALHAFLKAHPTGVFGAGAAAKATVFANFAGLTHKDILAVGDNTPAKIGKYLPGSRIPIVVEAVILTQQPEYIVIFPWNWREEISAKYRGMGYEGAFVVAVPSLDLF